MLVVKILFYCCIHFSIEFLIAGATSVIHYEDGHLDCLYNGSDSGGGTQCSESSYMGYFQKLIADNSNQYAVSVSKEIILLYDNLNQSMTPIVVPGSRLPSISGKGDYAARGLVVHPISFGFPDADILRVVPSKSKSFSTVIPGHLSTYVYKANNESLYFEDISQSLFSLTHKKAGWDCMRHLEILASGTLPLFINIAKCPTLPLAAHPKKLYELLLRFPGIVIKSTDDHAVAGAHSKLSVDSFSFDRSAGFNAELYMATVAALLRYTRNVLSTKAMARYVANTMVKYSKGVVKSNIPKRILYLNHVWGRIERGDYMLDLMLHGLKSMYGDAVVDDYPGQVSVYKTEKVFNLTDLVREKSHQYGLGYGWSYRLNSFSTDNKKVDFETVQKNLKNHVYDIVIFGSLHRDYEDATTHLHHWDLVCKHYDPLEVAVISGGDLPLSPENNAKWFQKFLPCSAHVFSREGIAAAP